MLIWRPMNSKVYTSNDVHFFVRVDKKHIFFGSGRDVEGWAAEAALRHFLNRARVQISVIECIKMRSGFVIDHVSKHFSN